MSEHTEVRDLLTLAAAGALDAAEQQRVQRHLQSCSACQAELDSWREITAALRRLPTPQPPAGLVERTRIRLAHQEATRAQQRGNQILLVCLIAFAWALTFLSWPVLQLVGEKVVRLFDIPFSNFTLAWIIYSAAAWLATGVVGIAIGGRRQREGRLA